MARVSIVVSADLPRGVSISEWKDYVLTEVKANTGQRAFEDPLFHLDRDSVRVTRLTVKTSPKARGKEIHDGV